MDIKEIKRELAGLWERTSELISLALETDIDYLAALNARLLENSGKQLRPVLALLVASACGQPNDDSPATMPPRPSSCTTRPFFTTTSPTRATAAGESPR